MQEIAAYSTLAVTMGLVLTRPRLLFFGVRMGPGGATALGVLVMLLLGVVQPAHLLRGFHDLWQPFLTILSIMITTGVAHRVGLLDYFAGLLERWIHRPTELGAPPIPTGRVFAAVFVFSAFTAAALNNDAAILLLTPLIVDFVRRCYPRRPDVVIAFSFAVFMAAGVAPLMISNPMNLILASHLGVDFNEYAARMVPISLFGWAMTLPALWLVFSRELSTVTVDANSASSREPAQLSGEGKAVLVLLIATLGAYPLVTSLGGDVWPVAAGCAVLGVAICLFRRVIGIAEVGASVSWEILLFLYCMLVIVFGLEHVGLVDHIRDLYLLAGDAAVTQIAVVGATSALGSAFLNNHPMAMLNQLAIETIPGAEGHYVFSALIGGDLGPRFLPMGSLAGLLWIDLLRRRGIVVRLPQFVAIGIAVTVPTLVLSLLLLLLEVKLGI